MRPTSPPQRNAPTSSSQKPHITSSVSGIKYPPIDPARFSTFGISEREAYPGFSPG
jgi:hypothetical protein